MKSWMQKTVIAFFLVGAANVCLAASTLKITVNGMVCAFCAQGIEKRLLKLPATQAVWVDLKKKIVAVELKDGQSLDPHIVKSEIVDAGYDVVKIETLPLSLSEIKAGE